jgi:hypothetical protein
MSRMGFAAFLSAEDFELSSAWMEVSVLSWKGGEIPFGRRWMDRWTSQGGEAEEMNMGAKFWLKLKRSVD